MSNAANVNAPEESTSRLRKALWVLGWAIFLACSWTWCIGMFLPALLVSDYNGWAWVAFMLPNVIGAGAMGFVLRNRAQSERLLEAHRPMLIGFSLVTLAFQVFFAAWLLPKVTGTGLWAPLLVVSLAMVLAALMVDHPRRTLAIAAVVFCISVGALTYAYGPGYELTSDAIEKLAEDDESATAADSQNRARKLARGKAAAAEQPAEPYAPQLFAGNDWPGEGSAFDLLFMTPIFLLGFIFCPYLDITFHRAYQEAGSPSRAKVAFALGFGLLFLLMITFTLLYAWEFSKALSGDFVRSSIAAMLLAPIVVHMIFQLGFTSAVHAREAAEAAYEGRFSKRMGVVVMCFIAAAAVLGLFADRYLQYGEMTGGELCYRLFMSFYGLVFPAYAWLCMIPRVAGGSSGRLIARPGKQQWLIFALVLCVAGPFYWLGFIERIEYWLLAGLAIVLLARLIPTKPGSAIAGQNNASTDSHKVIEN